MICDYCPHNCDINENYHGICKTKTIQGPSRGSIFYPGTVPGVNLSNRTVPGVKTMAYGQITSIALDPIEKKPLAGYMPGSKILSVGSWGCNMICPWCQNDSISRGPTDYYELTPEDIVEEALRQIPKGNIGIAYTYNEMMTNFEFVYDTAILAKEAGLKNVLVTNGMITDKYLSVILPYIDAYNIDLKTIDEDKYRKIGGDLPTVLNTIEKANKVAHVEVTTLIVPEFNDTEDEMKRLSQRLADIDNEIILHVTRFFPAGKYKDVMPTDVGLVYRMKEIASQNLKHVYTGNC